MGTPTQSYVDPSIAGNSGAGSIGDPWGDLQHALDTVVRDAVNGDQINILAGTDEILAAALDLTAYGIPTVTAWLMLRGYTSAADDGGIGGISGDGSYSMFASTALDYIALVDLHMHNSGAAIVVNLDNNILIYNCEVDNTTGGGINVDNDAQVTNCHVHNVGSVGIFAFDGIIFGCFVAYGANVPVAGISGRGVTIGNNIIKCSGAMNGITAVSANTSIVANSIWSNGGTGTGIAPAATPSVSVINNAIEGFIGVGGVGIGVSTADGFIMHSNASYNNATHFGTPTESNVVGNNDVLASSPFTNPGGDDFSPSGTVAGFTEDALPLTFKGSSTTNAAEKGAVQAAAGGGGHALLIGNV